MLMPNKTKAVFLRISAMILTVAALFFMQANPVNAGYILQLDPASGSFSSDFTIDLVYDDNGTSTSDVAVDLTYDGPVQFSSVTKGDFDCSALFDASETVDGVINFACTQSPIDDNPILISGVLAHFVFSPTGTGTTTMSLSNPVPDDADSMVGGTYTIVGGIGGYLPQTAIFDGTSVITISLILLGVGIFLGLKNSGLFRRRSFEDRFNSMYSKL